VLAAEHLLGLARVDFLRQVVEPFGEVVRDRLPRFRPLHEDGEVVGAAAKRRTEILIVLEAAPALQKFLRGGLIFPEVRR
jgi:hypothetical protein